MSTFTEWEIREYSKFDGGSLFTVFRRSPSDKSWQSASAACETLDEAKTWLSHQMFEPKLIRTYYPNGASLTVVK